MAASSSFSSPSKRNVVGYVHNVSEVTLSSPDPKQKNIAKAKTPKKFFTAILQQQKCYTPLRVFDETKKKVFDQAEKNHTLVELQNVIPSKLNCNEILVGNHSVLASPPPSELLQHVYKKPEKQTVTNVCDLPKTSDNQFYTITVKAIHVAAPDYDSSQFPFQESLFADSTGQIGTRLWKSKIDRFTQGQCYLLEKIKIAPYDGEPKIKFGIESRIVNLPEDQDIVVSFDDVEQKIEAPILSVQYCKNHSCKRCKDPIPDDRIQTNSFFCQTCDRKSNKKAYLIVTNIIKIWVDDDNGNEREYELRPNALPLQKQTMSPCDVEDWILDGTKVIVHCYGKISSISDPIPDSGTPVVAANTNTTQPVKLNTALLSSLLMKPMIEEVEKADDSDHDAEIHSDP